jgi:hypothetical protein
MLLLAASPRFKIVIFDPLGGLGVLAVQGF